MDDERTFVCYATFAEFRALGSSFISIVLGVGDCLASSLLEKKKKKKKKKKLSSQ